MLLNDVADQSDVDLDLSGLAEQAMGGTIAGALYVDWAWRYRGQGWGSTVTNDMAAAFAERLGFARNHLEAAIEADANDGVAYNFLFNTLRGLSAVVALESAWEAFLRADRKPIRAFASLAEALSPRWFGSDEVMLGFARTHQRALEPASHALIAHVANEIIFNRIRASDPQSATAFATQQMVLGEVGAANDAFSAGTPPADVYQARFGYGHFSFYFSFIGLHDLSRPHLLAMGDAIPPPWSGLNDPFGPLQRARTLAGLGAT